MSEYVPVVAADRFGPTMYLGVPEAGDTEVELDIEWFDDWDNAVQSCTASFTPAEAMEFSRLLAEFSLRVQLRNDTGLFEDPFAYEDEEHNRA